MIDTSSSLHSRVSPLFRVKEIPPEAVPTATTFQEASLVTDAVFPLYGPKTKAISGERPVATD